MMWSLCPECNQCGGCDCYVGTGGRYRIVDHEAELKRYEQDLKDELTLKYKPDKKAIKDFFEKRRKDENTNRPH